MMKINQILHIQDQETSCKKKRLRNLLLDAWYTPLNLLLDVHESNRKSSFVIDVECHAWATLG
jgi:hypothetical protein